MDKSYDILFEELCLHSNGPSKKLPKVSIVIPHYNSGDLIYEALN